MPNWRWSILLLFLVFTQKVNAQRKFVIEDALLMPGTFYALGGVVFPQLDLADKSYKLESGYAKTGYQYGIGFGYEIAPLIGISLQYTHLQNPFDNNNYEGDLIAANTNLDNIRFESKDWSLNGLLVGMYVPFKTYRTTIDIGASTGMIRGVLPQSDWRYTAGVQQTPYHYRQESSREYNWGFAGTILLKYSPFDPKFSNSPFRKCVLLGGVQFLYTKLTYKNLILTDVIREIPYYIDDYTQKYHQLQLFAGIGVQFD